MYFLGSVPWHAGLVRVGVLEVGIRLPKFRSVVWTKLPVAWIKARQNRFFSARPWFNKDRLGLGQSSPSLCFVALAIWKSLLNTRRALFRTTAIFVEPRAGRKKRFCRALINDTGSIVQTTGSFVQTTEQSLIITLNFFWGGWGSVIKGLNYYEIRIWSRLSLYVRIVLESRTKHRVCRFCRHATNWNKNHHSKAKIISELTVYSQLFFPRKNQNFNLTENCPNLGHSTLKAFCFWCNVYYLVVWKNWNPTRPISNPGLFGQPDPNP